MMLLAVTSYFRWRASCRDEVIAAVSKNGGQVAAGRNLFDVVLARMRGNRQVTRSPSSVILHAEGFDNEWVRKHDFLEAIPIDDLLLDGTRIDGEVLEELVRRYPTVRLVPRTRKQASAHQKDTPPRGVTIRT